MTHVEPENPWPRMRSIVEAVVHGLHGGRFIEETLESLCVQLGASSAWSTLQTKGSGGPLHRSRTAGFSGVSPAVLAEHVTAVLARVRQDLKTIGGPVPYADEGSFAAVPLWSHPTASKAGRRLIGAMYMEFPGDQGTRPLVLEFVQSVGTLLGGVIAQQELIEDTREDLRVEKAKDHNEHHMRLEDLLAPDSMVAVREELTAALLGNASIMILGASGTGKTQLATAFARASNQEPIVRATLGMADDLNTITSELFGHERGSFSGAVSKRKGLVEYADGGTLILDEVLNLPPRAQQLLLDFTQFGSYRPLGYQGREPKRSDLRLISVTNGDMQAAIAARQFREDLYYRLATVPIVLPALRDRRHEIPTIAEGYLRRTDGGTPWELDGDAVEAITSSKLEWTGNIRELESVLERARNRARVAEGDDPIIQAHHLDLGVAPPTAAPATNVDATNPQTREQLAARLQRLNDQRSELDGVEKGVIEDALRTYRGIVAHTAKALAVPRTGLISRMATLDVDPNRFKG